MDKQEAINILARYQTENSTAEERRLVEDWAVYGAAEPFDLTDSELLEDLVDIRLRLESDLIKQRSARTVGFRRWLPYVAAVLFTGIIGIWVIQRDKNIEQVSLKSQDIQPGGHHATLKLSNGKTIDLIAAQKGIIVGEKITYPNGAPVTTSGSGVQLLTLSTPKGGTYQVTLPDGSKVWLNSDSKLVYPSQFNGNQRIVELEGEAYFEVSKKRSLTNQSKLPFLVKTPEQTVEVLGTQFNISAYSDDATVKTTLVEGSVKVALGNTSAQSKSKHSILKPGQQSVVYNGKSTVNEVNVSSFIGWKDGYFIFNGTELRDAMKQLGRWYNVEVSYEGILPRTLFYGKISRDDTLADALFILKEGKVNFRIEKHGETNKLIVLQ